MSDNRDKESQPIGGVRLASPASAVRCSRVIFVRVVIAERL